MPEAVLEMTPLPSRLEKGPRGVEAAASARAKALAEIPEEGRGGAASRAKVAPVAARPFRASGSRELWGAPPPKMVAELDASAPAL